ncbi:MAG: hypothetical protein KA293_02225, partial [Bacteroidia bacterium]|nr:hypothetical protein [Bacteroidia bacterium]
ISIVSTVLSRFPLMARNASMIFWSSNIYVLGFTSAKVCGKPSRFPEIRVILRAIVHKNMLIPCTVQGLGLE